MARITASSSRGSRNVRNGPSALQTRLAGLFREARWLLFAGLAAWLGLVLATWYPTDPGWSHSVQSYGTQNRGGTLGAYMADLLYYLLGYSAWLIVVLLVYHIVIGFYRITSVIWPGKNDPLPRVKWEVGIGFTLLLLGSMGIEAQRFPQTAGHLPGGAGGQLGQLLAHSISYFVGSTGATMVMLGFLAAGLSLFFGFSWLNVAERVGYVVEQAGRWLLDAKTAREDRKAGLVRAEERNEMIEARHEQRGHPEHTLRIEPAITAVPQAAMETEEPVMPMPAIAPIRTKPVPSEKPKEKTAQPPVHFTPAVVSSGDLPDVALLDPPAQAIETVSPETIEYTSRLIEKKLADFGVNVVVVAAQAGPVITRYEIEPATGVKGSQVVNLAKDLARALSLVSIRVVETIPGKNLMGLELPNPKRQMVRLSEIIGSQTYHAGASLLTMALGKDIAGNPVVADLAKMPHLLVAGTTGSGKSVGINAMILSLLYKAGPEDVRLILIDPKMLEMSVYEDIPHLLAPVVTDMRQAANALNWCVGEMEKRYRLMSKLGVRNLAGYNVKIRDAIAREEPIANPFSLTPDAPEPLSTLPMIVVVIDELADLMMVVGKKIEELIARLAQKARAAGIHLILATQRPSVDVITGLIKANIPTRIAFQVSSKIDSRTILDQMGAETLLGQGDMLYMPPGSGLPMRVHGAFVNDDEVHRVVAALKAQGEPNYVEGLLESSADSDGGAVGGALSSTADAESDPLYDQAVEIVLTNKRASISSVQRHLRIGYNRAARLLEQMEQAGLVSPMQSNGNREILVPARKDASNED